jgi:hypothetical protein
VLERREVIQFRNQRQQIFRSGVWSLFVIIHFCLFSGVLWFYSFYVYFYVLIVQ